MLERARTLLTRRAPTPSGDKLAGALRKRQIERILRDEGMTRSAAERATRRIFEAMNDERR